MVTSTIRERDEERQRERERDGERQRIGVSLLCSKIYLLCYAALLQKLPIMLNKCPYYAQILLIKWLMYYNLDFAMAD